MDSVSTSETVAALAALPIQSPSQSVYNCLVEHIVDPLSTSALQSNSHSKSQKSTRDNKSPKASVPTISKQKIPILDSPELKEAADWSATASNCASEQPDQAYKLFAKAGQVFAASYRTKEAGHCFYSVFRLQMDLMRAKSTNFGWKPASSIPSMSELFDSTQSELDIPRKQLAGGLLVLFKSSLYLARLFRPINTTLASKWFWRSLECIFPSHFWDALRNIVSAISPDMAALSAEVATACAKIQPVASFVNSQRKQAADANPSGAPAFTTLESEIATACREFTGLLCAKDPLYIGIALIETATQLTETISAPSTQIVPNYEWLSLLFGALKLYHLQADYCFKSFSLCSTLEMQLSYCAKAMVCALQLNDLIRLKRYVAAIIIDAPLPVQQDPVILFLVNLAVCLFKNDEVALELFLSDPWTRQMLKSGNPQLENLQSLLPPNRVYI